jgi:GNAT superfamily N-acetyltransferase
VAPAIEVRDARPDDADRLVALWRAMAVGTGHQSRLLTAPTAASARASVTKQLADPSCRLIVGEIDGVVDAMAFLRLRLISPLHDDVTVAMEYLHVSDSARRHGLGKALIAEATAWAEREHSPHLAVLVPAPAREANRFLARLGLGQAGVMRFASTHTVRRRLAAEHSPTLLAQLSSRRSVLARRARLTRPPLADDTTRGAPTAELSFPAAPESAGT